MHTQQRARRASYVEVFRRVQAPVRVRLGGSLRRGKVSQAAWLNLSVWKNMAAGCAALLRRAAPERRSADRSRGIGATRARFRCHRARACLGSEVVEAKQALLSAAAGTSRGARASEQAAAAVLGAFERVEGLNACEAPADLPEMLDGWYSLLYQAPEDPSKASAATTTEGPFLGRLRPLLRALAKPTAQRQRIDSVGGRVDNVAEFELLLGALRGYLNLRGTWYVGK